MFTQTMWTKNQTDQNAELTVFFSCSKSCAVLRSITLDLTLGQLLTLYPWRKSTTPTLWLGSHSHRSPNDKTHNELIDNFFTELNEMNETAGLV